MTVILLFANGLFNLLVWPTFYRRVAKDPRARDAAGKPTRFLRVHAVLIGIALLLAVLSIAFGIVQLTAGV
jgi:hypothetical protein